ncbi:putative RNA methyltransferase [Oceanobacillus sp. FSL W8-0428]|uniref:Uncharacterized protein n=1 Tax=Oceanobacillus sojae TaxID=582851 RepID=A0A511ZL87_9BACI|nr:methyltransferase domain-containing protein [Oceanobacillus sojae]GEN88186.1 hypothetical protein OSO01_29250 [Oceanobacillus sojae]
MNKRTLAAEYASHSEAIFKCPVCNSSMRVFELKNLICSNNHTFDFSKQGYINLMSHPVKSMYNRSLFQARRKLITEAGFFEPLIQAIAEMIYKHAAIERESLSLIDTGCGEGSHLFNICESIRSKYQKTVTGVGIDISKEGILEASKSYANKIWTVGDLANTPFMNEQFDVILNILSPSNYNEFNRVLKADGLLIKVVPQTSYLKELREIIFNQPEKQSYSNTDTVVRFNENFQMVDNSRISYTLLLDKLSIQSLVEMTPLSWEAPKEQVKSFLDEDTTQITVDLEILIGKKR